MNDTSGQKCDASSRSADLQLCLENRLRARLAGRGSPLYALTWKEWPMESGPPICALRARALRTSDSACSGWPTPCQQDGPNGGPSQGADRLPGAAALAGWPTPSAHGSQGESSPDLERVGEKWVNRVTGRVLQTNLATDAKLLAGWPTPATLDAQTVQDVHRLNLSQAAVVLTGPARLTVAGDLLTGSSAQMANGGQLNPALPRWLMGYPPEWDDCAVTAMQSLSTPRKRSSKVS